MPKKHTIVFSFFYNIAIFFMVLIFLPKLLKRVFNKEIPSAYFKNRFGFGLKEIKKNSRGAIWFHAVSLGEMKAISPLVAAFKKEFPSVKFIFSTSTMTGYNEGKKVYPNDGVFFLPLDFSFIIKPFVKAIHPKYVIFSETDLWYHLLQSAKQQEAYNVIASAKLSEKSLRNYLRFSFFAKKIFGVIDLFCCQNELYRDRLQEAGVPPSKLKVTGNLKYDVKYPLKTEEQKLEFKKKLGIDECIVLGSTHPHEEEQLLDALLPLKQTIVIVPRHPNRFEEVRGLLEKRGLTFFKLSDQANRPLNAQVILVDAMGQLLSFYEISLLAIVAGSYQPIGGHNILEPLAYGTPVIFGPQMHTQFELVDLVLNAKAGLQVPLNELKTTVDRLLQNRDELARMGQNGKVLTDSLQGVTKKTIDEIHAVTLKGRK